jgi:predicted alpha/beta-hydrolase family hydrolase
VNFHIDGPASSPRAVVLAHGAGAGMHTPFLDFFAEGLAARAVRVVRFEFPYMERIRQTGKREPPDSQRVLEKTWLDVIAALGGPGLVIGGKSMGGRIASMVADQAGVLGLVCLGYPFHAVGKPERLRVEHLHTLKTPALIVQGQRDPFGNRDEVAGYGLSPAVRVAWMEDGDHDLKPRKWAGRTQEENWRAALDEVARFIESRFGGAEAR